MVALEIFLNTTTRTEAVDITPRIEAILEREMVKEGLCFIYVPHTTAAITINENADPSVMKDFMQKMEELVPWTAKYSHTESNSAAHIKAILCGSSVTVVIKGGELLLGRWQGVFFMEFDGPRKRKVYIKIIKG